MRYLPSACTALGMSAAVAYAVYITKNPNCLWALLIIPAALEWTKPRDPSK